MHRQMSTKKHIFHKIIDSYGAWAVFSCSRSGLRLFSCCHLILIRINMEETRKMNRFKAAVLLLTTTFFWGVTFTVVKQAVASVDVFVFLSQLFLLAFLLIVPICAIRGKRLEIRTVRQGSLLGLFL